MAACPVRRPGYVRFRRHTTAEERVAFLVSESFVREQKKIVFAVQAPVWFCPSK